MDEENLLDSNFVIELLDSWGMSKETQNVFKDVRDYVYLKLTSTKIPPTIKVAVKSDGKRKTFYKPSIAGAEKAFILHVTNQSEEISTQTKLRQEEHLAKNMLLLYSVSAIFQNILFCI